LSDRLEMFHRCFHRATGEGIREAEEGMFGSNIQYQDNDREKKYRKTRRVLSRGDGGLTVGVIVAVLWGVGVGDVAVILVVNVRVI
jgi:hypothetical protein